LEVLGGGQLNTIGPRTPRTASPSRSPMAYRSLFLLTLASTGFQINLCQKSTSKREPGCGWGRTRAFVVVDAGFPIAGVALVARACEAPRGAGGVGAHRVGGAVVHRSIYDRGVMPVSSSVSPKRVRAISHTGSTGVGLGGPRSGSIDYGSSYSY